VSTIPSKERSHEEPRGRDVVCVSFGIGGRRSAAFPRERTNAGEQVASTYHYPRKTYERQECETAFNIDATAQPSIARLAREGLADPALGEPPSASESAPTDSRFVERATVDFYLLSRSPNGWGDDPSAIFRNSPFRNGEVAQ
jgi:hypothetical protein